LFNSFETMLSEPDLLFPEHRFGFGCRTRCRSYEVRAAARRRGRPMMAFARRSGQAYARHLQSPGIGGSKGRREAARLLSALVGYGVIRLASSRSGAQKPADALHAARPAVAAVSAVKGGDRP